MNSFIQPQEFYKIAFQNKLISKEKAEAYYKEFKQDLLPAIKKLLQQDKVPKSILGKVIGDELKLSYVDMEKTLVEKNAVKLIPENVARKFCVIPLYIIGGESQGGVVIASSNPKNQPMLDDIQRICNRKIEPVFSFPDEIMDAIEIEYRSSENVDLLSTKVGDLLKKIENAKRMGLSTQGASSNVENSQVSMKELRAISGDNAVIELTRTILLMAAKEKASDIHIEPTERNIRVRFRIDGILQNKFELDKELLQPLVSRLKILASLDITEKRKPQDGRVSLKLTAQSIDYRFSSMPSIYGEKIVLRVLGQLEKKKLPDLTELNFAKTELKKIKNTVISPNGIFLVTGPTGSGKSTTLYSIMNFLNNPEINIMTIEDPVEYRLDGVNQCQVNASIDLSFAVGLRSFLRQDPDIILVGEIRDSETAKIAMEAALTGHLVFATMHTNSAIESITRLIEIGIEPYLVAPSLVGILAQRLVRKICTGCKERYLVEKHLRDELFYYKTEQDLFFFKGKGCPNCNYTGYSGRIALHEVFIVNNEIRQLIAKNEPVIQVHECAKKHEFRTLRYDGLLKVLRGLTTLAEVDRVTKED